MEKKIFQDKLIGLQNNLYNFALQLTCNRDDANDLLQETSLKVLDNENKYIEAENFKGWSFTIMRNIFINNYRRMVKYNANTAIDSCDMGITLGYSENTPEGSMTEKEIKNIIGEFSEEFRKPLSMYMIGYSYQEISESLNIPLGTVKSRIHLARKELKVRLVDFR